MTVHSLDQIWPHQPTFLALLLRVDFLQLDPFELRLHLFLESILAQTNECGFVLHAHAVILHVLVDDVVSEFAEKWRKKIAITLNVNITARWPERYGPLRRLLIRSFRTAQ